MPYDELQAEFASRFGRTAEVVARAPGRVNLIGEHTDYNDGFVLPMAIEFEVVCVAARRRDRRVRLWSREYAEPAEFDLDSRQPAAQRWAAYVQGMGIALQEFGLPVWGMDALIAGDVPQGAGLSSSAALEMAAGLVLGVHGLNCLSRVTLARCGQWAENHFLGVQSGIMDQYISALAQAGGALLIDCRALTSEVVPLPLDERGLAIVVVESGVARGLVDSEYNARRRECEEGVRLLQGLLPGRRIGLLRDVTQADLDAYGAELAPTILRRVRHVVTENARVLESAAALGAGDMRRFGRLMFASHASMRDDYEITVPPVDLLISLSAGYEGVLGARMTGGGFGGSTVHLMEVSALPRFAADVVAEYERQTGLRAPMYRCRPMAGASYVQKEITCGTT